MTMTHILSNTSYAPHILLKWVEIYKIFIYIHLAFIRTSGNSNDSVAFQSLTIFLNLNKGYKTKVIILPPKRSIITSNEEKKMIMLKEICDSMKACSSRLFFGGGNENLCLWGWCLQSLKINLVKKTKFLLEGWLLYGLESSIKNSRGIYP